MCGKEEKEKIRETKKQSKRNRKGHGGRLCDSENKEEIVRE